MQANAGMALKVGSIWSLLLGFLALVCFAVDGEICMTGMVRSLVGLLGIEEVGWG